MLPVGPYTGPGGQHGPLRYADFVHAATTTSITRRGGGYLHLLELEAAFPEDSPIAVTRHVGFAALNGFMISTTVRNLTAEPMHTSMGEHIYLAMGSPTVADVQLNQSSIEECAGSGATAAVDAGKPRIWRGYDGHVTARLHGTHNLEIVSRTYSIGGDTGQAVPDMLVWRRVVDGQPTPTMCLEPVVGLNHSPSNSDNPIHDQLTIPAGESVTQRTLIRVLQAA